MPSARLGGCCSSLLMSLQGKMQRTPPWSNSKGRTMTNHSDPFERHQIKHLSPSSLRLWRDEPAVWIGKYLLHAPDESGPGGWRGQAVEAGGDQLLSGGCSFAAAETMANRWDQLAQGLIDPDAEKESEALGDFLVQAGTAFAGKPVPLQRQAKVQLELPGISVPLIGYADWLWPDCGDDLKTTWRMPNGGQPDPSRSEEHTSELQSLRHLVCRL